MDVKTKFDIGDEVLYLDSGEVERVKIKGITIMADGYWTEVKYWLDKDSFPDYVEEYKLFKSKEELLESLKEMIKSI